MMFLLNKMYFSNHDAVWRSLLLTTLFHVLPAPVTGTSQPNVNRMMCAPGGPADLRPMTLPKNASCPKEISASWVEVDTLCSILNTEEGGKPGKEERRALWVDGLEEEQTYCRYDGWPVCRGWGQAGCTLPRARQPCSLLPCT